MGDQYWCEAFGLSRVSGATTVARRFNAGFAKEIAGASR